MKFGLYIKDKLGIIAGYTGFVIFTYLLMMAFHSQLQMRIMFVIVAVIFVVSVIAFDYLRKYKFYNSLVGHLDELDQKYSYLTLWTSLTSTRESWCIQLCTTSTSP